MDEQTWLKQMSLDPIFKTNSLLLKQLMHLVSPNNFEYYLIALEVRDFNAPSSSTIIKKTLIFPVNPERILIMEKKMSKTTKTYKGVVVNEIETFVPTPLNISGTFGRKAKVLYGSGGRMGDNHSIAGIDPATSIKTGYGVLKDLQSLHKLSRLSNKNGKPYRTILYNLMFSSVYVVELGDLKISMSQDKNMLWYYDLSMTVVSPVDGLEYNPWDVSKLMTYDAISKGMSKALDNAQTIANSYLYKIL